MDLIILFDTIYESFMSLIILVKKVLISTK